MHDQFYIQRCLQLAKLGAGLVAPNPMVGAVLVHKDRIIGEGWHAVYGQAHAEVNCLASVKDEDRPFIPESVLYVSLEPCSHYGKTPPCADLIIRERIPRVVIGARDPFVQVNGKGIERLQQAGIHVDMIKGQEAIESQQLNKRFFCFHTKKRPYVILKWAQTKDGVIANASSPSRLLISNEYSNRLVHKWRQEEHAILIGTNTALLDNPALTNRLWTGSSPVRIVLDKELRLPNDLQLFKDGHPTIIFNSNRHDIVDGKAINDIKAVGGVHYYKIPTNNFAVEGLMNAAYLLQVQSIFVEGGAFTLQSFIDAGVWDEIKTITNETLMAGEGLTSPQIKNAIEVTSNQIAGDTIRTFLPAMKSY